MSSMVRQRALVLYVEGVAGTQRRARKSERVLVTYAPGATAPDLAQVRNSVALALWKAKVRRATFRVANVPVDVLMEAGEPTTLTFVPRSGTERDVLVGAWDDKRGITETPT